MAITMDGQWEIGGILIGNGTVYPVEGVTGLGVPEAKTRELELATGDGTYTGPEWLAAREVELLIGIDATPDSAAYDNAIAALSSAFAPRSALTLVRYQRFSQLRRFWARPRGLALPWGENFHMGLAQAEGRLLCPDPIVYADAATTVSGSGSVSVTNTGNRGVWPTLTVNGPGSVVTLRNDSDAGRDLILKDLGGTAVIDFAVKTVVVAGTSKPQAIDPGSSWWRVQPGANSLVLTGASSIDVSFRAGRVSG